MTGNSFPTSYFISLFFIKFIDKIKNTGVTASIHMKLRSMENWKVPMVRLLAIITT